MQGPERSYFRLQYLHASLMVFGAPKGVQISFVKSSLFSIAPSSCKMRLSYSALAPLWLWPWSLLAAGPAANGANCALLPFGRPSASDCVNVVNHIIPEEDDPIGLVLRSYPRYPFMSMPIFWFYSQFFSCFAVAFLTWKRDVHRICHARSCYLPQFRQCMVGLSKPINRIR